MAEQLPLFHEPVNLPGPKHETATPPLFHGQDTAEQQAVKLFAKWAELDVIIFRPRAPAANATAIHRDGTTRPMPRHTVQDYLRRMIAQGKRIAVADQQKEQQP